MAQGKLKAKANLPKNVKQKQKGKAFTTRSRKAFLKLKKNTIKNNIYKRYT